MDLSEAESTSEYKLTDIDAAFLFVTAKDRKR